MSEGTGFLMRHAFLLLDGSGSMRDPEIISKQPKHLQVAKMVQNLIDSLTAPVFVETYLTILGYDSDGGSLRSSEPLSNYDVQTASFAGNTDLALWDPIKNHGGGTPIGSILAIAREKAEQWVNTAIGQENRRALIYLLSDGQNNTGPDGLLEKDKILTFNQSHTNGVIRLATIGYFQHQKGSNIEEDSGRSLLEKLPTNPNAFFESNNIDKILSYIVSTISSN